MFLDTSDTLGTWSYILNKCVCNYSHVSSKSLDIISEWSLFHYKMFKNYFLVVCLEMKLHKKQ